MSYIPIRLPAQFGTQTILATAFYLSGYIYRNMNYTSKHPLTWGIALLLVPAAAAMFANWGMYECKGWEVLPFYVVAMIGTLGVMQVCRWLARQHRTAGVLAYIGGKTLYILTFHFLAFKLISLLYIQHRGMPIKLLSQFPVIEDAPPYLWIAYGIAGVCLPLMVWELFHRKKINFGIYKHQRQSEK